MSYILRTSCCFDFEHELHEMDSDIKFCLERIINCQLDDEQWILACLPVHYGGIGIRKLSDIALPAFLSSVNSVTELVNTMLPTTSDESIIANYSEALTKWSSINENEIPEHTHSQKEWDLIVVKRIVQSLTLSSDDDKARYNASTVKESNFWLTVLPSRHVGSLLDNNTFRIAVGLRLGCDICIPRKCRCGQEVDRKGLHGLSCKRSAGRLPCHSEMNNIIWRGLQTANFPAKLEPPIFRSDGRCADGVTLVPWSNGKMLLWDATIRDTVAPSYVRSSSRRAGYVARRGADDKLRNYKSVVDDYIFVPFACETLGPCCSEAIQFVQKLGDILNI